MVGTITYDWASNTVTAVGGTPIMPMEFVDLWNADKAGSLTLRNLVTLNAANGYPSIGNVTTNDANFIYATAKFTLQARAKAQAIKMHIKTACNAIVGIYTDVSGVPSALAVQSSSEVCSADAWHTFTIPETVLAAGTYWIGYVTDTTNSGVANTLSGIQTYAHAYTFGALPSSFGALTYNSTNCRSAYVLVKYEFGLTAQVRPADSKALKLAVAVSAVNGSVPLTFSGLDKDGVAQTETLTVTSATSYTTEKWFSNINANGVSIPLDDGETVTLTITQAQWGVVWKMGANQYAFDAKLVIGDGSTATVFVDTNKSVAFNDLGLVYPSASLSVTDNAALTLGTLLDASAKTVQEGCSLINYNTSAVGYIFIQGATTDAVNLYACQVTASGNAQLRYCHGKIYHCVFGRYIRVAVSVFDIFDLSMWYGTDTGAISVSSGTFDSVTIGNYVYALAAYGTYPQLVAKNCKLLNNTYDLYVNTLTDNDAYLINMEAAWTFFWVGNSTKKIYRQYEFDLTVTDKTNTPLQGATVTLTDKNGTQAFSAMTNANGAIATQTITRGYYQQSTGDTLHDQAPHTLTVAKAGYQTYIKKFVITEKTRWAIKLATTQTVLLASGKLSLNLKPTDPENKIVLYL